MSETNGTPVDAWIGAGGRARAEAVWAAYRREHAEAEYRGQTVCVDADTGEVFVAPVSSEIFARLDAEGRSRPLHFVQQSEAEAKVPVRRMGWGSCRRVK